MPPNSDHISCLKFAPMNQTYQQFGSLLACAFWDGTLVIYQANIPNIGDQIQTQIMINNNTGGAPILGICWCPEQPALLIACADNNIKKWDLPTNQVINVGSHTQPVKDIYTFY